MSAFERLRAFLAERDDAERFVAPEMRSLLLPGDAEHIVVLLHGLTASPPAWAAVADALNARGATVVALRLPLHGHDDRLSPALRALSAPMLTADLHEVLLRVAEIGGRVTVAGHSLGGTLAVHAGAHVGAVDRIVAVAPFLGIWFLPHELHALAIAAINVAPNVFLWWDPLLRDRQQPAHGYPRYPLHTIGAGLAIADAVYREASRAPAARAIDVVLNERESSVNNRAALHLAKRWRAAGASVAVHAIAGLPPSHDIVDPSKPNAARVRESLVGVILGEHVAEDRRLAL